jgi:hypothetical protein
MRTLFYILTFFTFLTACSTKTDKSDKDLTESDTIENTLIIVNDNITDKEWTIYDSMDCNLEYDTITNKKYDMHLAILDKYHNKEKRGYFFSAQGDTINEFLYHQDIAAFILGLDPTEQGIYKILTNKVVFLILENEPKMLDGGLTWMKKEKLEYFFEHIEHPICNSLPIDNIAKIIKGNMAESNEKVKNAKQVILNRLNMAKQFEKQRHANKG